MGTPLDFGPGFFVDINGNLVEPSAQRAFSDDSATRRQSDALLVAPLVAATSSTAPGTLGRDVSSYDGSVNWRTYAFGINKVTESNNFVSPGWSTRKAQILSGGCVYGGGYHFARPGDGAAQADFSLSVTGLPMPMEWPLWLDYEVSGLGRQFRDDFITRYRLRTGTAPGFYTYLNMWQSEGIAGTLPDDVPVWMARYSTSGPGVNGVRLWQFQGGPDLDRCFVPTTVLMTINRRPAPAVVRGPAVTYPYGPDPASPLATGPQSGIKPTGSVVHITTTGETWTTIRNTYFGRTTTRPDCAPYGGYTTTPDSLKQWHSDHGGNKVYAGYYSFGAGARVVLPTSSPGILGAA